jgi:hypothetical protein
MRIARFDHAVNLLQAILWMYDGATNLKSIIEQKQAWYDQNQQEFWISWYNDVFNLLTANAFGITVWSRILNIPVYSNVSPAPSGAPVWGFGMLNENFGHGNFAYTSPTIILTLEEQRFLLRLKYFQLCSNGAIPAVNAFLNYLLSTSNIEYSGTIYVLDGLDMSITYVFTAPNFPDKLLKAIKSLDVLPRCSGVRIKYAISSEFLFGFGRYNKNFSNGNFIQTIS